MLPVGWCLKCLHSCSQSGRAPWRPAIWLTAWTEPELNSWMASNSLEEQGRQGGRQVVITALKHWQIIPGATKQQNVLNFLIPSERLLERYIYIQEKISRSVELYQIQIHLVNHSLV